MSNIIDLRDPAMLAQEVRSGRIWSAPGWGIELAIEAINNGTLPRPGYVPEEYEGFITAEVTPDGPEFIEPATTGTPSPIETEVPL